ncbi:MAG: hypothetical protein PUE08_08690 [Eubacteriales bacterium]|nr:hypothetical protein [Eubacteriales bacterium]
MDKKDKKKQNGKKNKKQIIDLTSYISPESVNCDVNGSYTGIPADMYYNNELDELPVQDADDL